MRLAAQAKMGWYPVRPATIDFVASRLLITDPASTYTLDPCCGRGAALAQLTQNLNVPMENAYGVELDEKRATAATELLSNVLNASFFGVRIVPVQSFSLLWANPPYEDEPRQDDESGRPLEQAFLLEAARYVAVGGVMILHMPRDRMSEDVIRTFCATCDEVHLVTLPPEMRPFREALLIGTRKKKVERITYCPTYKTVEHGKLPRFTVPAGVPIRTWQKTEPTDAEIESALTRAPFMKVFTQKRKIVKLRPLLPLGPGHLGLVLAAGFLDGYTAPPGYEPHVVRGIAYKENNLVKEETEEKDDGGETTTQTFRESIKLKIRAITADGTIHDIK